MFQRYNGDPNIQMYKKKVSTTFTIGDAVVIDANGFLDKAVTATTVIQGIIMQTVLATDANYAVAEFIPVDVPRRGDQFLADVTTGTPAQTHVGETHDLVGSGGINLTTVLTNIVKVEKILGDATKAIISFPNTAG